MVSQKSLFPFFIVDPDARIKYKAIYRFKTKSPHHEVLGHRWPWLVDPTKQEDSGPLLAGVHSHVMSMQDSVLWNQDWDASCARIDKIKTKVLSPYISRQRETTWRTFLQIPNHQRLWLDAIWSHSLCAASIFPAQEIVFQQPMNAMGGGEAQSWRAIGVRRVLTSAALLLGWIYTCMCAQQCTMRTLESRVEPYAKRTIIYTEAPRHLRHLPTRLLGIIYKFVYTIQRHIQPKI